MWGGTRREGSARGLGPVTGLTKQVEGTLVVGDNNVGLCGREVLSPPHLHSDPIQVFDVEQQQTQDLHVLDIASSNGAHRDREYCQEEDPAIVEGHLEEILGTGAAEPQGGQQEEEQQQQRRPGPGPQLHSGHLNGAGSLGDGPLPQPGCGSGGGGWLYLCLGVGAKGATGFGDVLAPADGGVVGVGSWAHTGRNGGGPYPQHPPSLPAGSLRAGATAAAISPTPPSAC